MKQIAKGVDFFFNKLLPKKFLVLVVATYFVIRQLSVPAEWYYLAMIYIGGNVIQKYSLLAQGRKNATTD